MGRGKKIGKEGNERGEEGKGTGGRERKRKGDTPIFLPGLTPMYIYLE